MIKNLMKVNVQEELEQHHSLLQKTHEDVLANSGLNEVKGLLGYDENRHNQIMSKMGLNSANVAIMNVQSKVLELEKEQDYYGGKVFNEEQIKNLCVKYRLKFLTSNLFIGRLDIEMVAKIKELEKQIANSMVKEQANKKELTIEQYINKYGKPKFAFDDHDLQSKFFIMAPPKMFNLDKEKRELGIQRFGKFLNSMIPKDPVLFYAIGDDKYKTVHKWGNDFSILRLVKGIVYKNETSLLMWRALTIIALTTLIIASFTNLFINGYFGYNVLTIMSILVLSGIVTVFSLPQQTSVLYSEHGWNKSLK